MLVSIGPIKRRCVSWGSSLKFPDSTLDMNASKELYYKIGNSMPLRKSRWEHRLGNLRRRLAGNGKVEKALVEKHAWQAQGTARRPACLEHGQRATRGTHRATFCGSFRSAVGRKKENVKLTLSVQTGKTDQCKLEQNIKGKVHVWETGGILFKARVI